MTLEEAERLAELYIKKKALLKAAKATNALGYNATLVLAAMAVSKEYQAQLSGITIRRHEGRD